MGLLIKQKKILFMSDNKAVVGIVNTTTCTSNDHILMQLVRRLVLCCLRSNILFKAKHIPGKLNTLADKLSRFQFQEAANIAPNLSPVQTFIPSHLLQI